MREETKERLLVEEAFEKYKKLVGIDEEINSEVQITETKRAFYAGYGSALTHLMDLADLPDDTAVPLLEKLRVEVCNFWATAV